MRDEMQSQTSTNNRKIITIFFLAVFVFCMVFFGTIHPLVIFDSDDWTYISACRVGYPSIKEWNPARIMPETIPAFISYIGAKLIYPITKDYIFSLTLIWDIVLSVVIVAYLFAVYKIYENNVDNKSSKSNSLLITAIIFALHFSIFKNQQSKNVHLFYSINFTSYLYYIIPNLLISVLTLALFFYKTDYFSLLSIKKKSIILFVIYICVFANLFQTGILLSAVAADILIEIYKELKNGGVKGSKRIVKILRNKWIDLFIIGCALIEAIFDGNGARAESIGIKFDLIEAIKSLLNWRNFINPYCKILFVTILVLFVAVVIRKRRDEVIKNDGRMVVRLLLCAAINSVYLILLCSKTGADYLNRPDVAFGIFFYLLLAFGFCLNTVVNNIPYSCFVIFLMMFGVITYTNKGTIIFRNSTVCNVSYEQAKAVDDNIIEQIRNAVQNGQDTMTLYVPQGVLADNWPHANYAGGRIVSTLMRHGVIDRYIEISIQPDPEMNKKYNLTY